MSNFANRQTKRLSHVNVLAEMIKVTDPYKESYKKKVDSSQVAIS